MKPKRSFARARHPIQVYFPTPNKPGIWDREICVKRNSDFTRSRNAYYAKPPRAGAHPQTASESTASGGQVSLRPPARAAGSSPRSTTPAASARGQARGRWMVDREAITGASWKDSAGEVGLSAGFHLNGSLLSHTDVIFSSDKNVILTSDVTNVISQNHKPSPKWWKCHELIRQNGLQRAKLASISKSSLAFSSIFDFNWVPSAKF